MFRLVDEEKTRHSVSLMSRLFGVSRQGYYKHRNRALGDCLAVRLTTTKKKPRPTVIPLGPADPLVGWVLCDEITLLYGEDLAEDAGALSFATMTSVAAGLKAALALQTTRQ